MSIIHLQGQPVVFNYPEGECDTCEPQDFCMLANEDDQIEFQFRQSPCGDTLICDGDFSAVTFDLVTNGGFTGSATGWTLGSGWTYGANKVSCNAAPGHGTLSQTIGTPLVNGKQYRLVFTLSNCTGNVAVNPFVGGNASLFAATANGTYAIDVVCGAGNIIEFFQNLTTATFDIDNIELYEYSPCWTGTTFWRLADGNATHIPGSTAVLSQVTPTLISGRLYQVRYTIENYVAGHVQMRLGTVLGIEAAANGDVVEYITANGTGFSLVPSSDFNGSVMNISVKQLKNDFLFQMVNPDDHTDVYATITDADIYFEDFVTFKFKPIERYNPGVPYCFRIYMVDQCTEYGDNLLLNPNFVDGFTDWVSANGNMTAAFRSAWGLASLDGLIRQFPWELPGPPELFVDPGGVCLSYAYSFSVTGDFLDEATAFLRIAGVQTVVATAPGTYEGIVDTSSPASNAIRVEITPDPDATTERIYYSNLSVKCLLDVDIEYLSQCIMVKPEHTCTVVLEAYCKNNSFGFNFTDPYSKFRPKMRMPIIKFAASYPSEETTYQFSTGRKDLITSSLEKFWTLTTDMLPEWAHDFIAVAKISSYFLLDGVEYRPKEGNYQPDWITQPTYPLASAEFDVRKTEINQFNNACE